MVIEEIPNNTTVCQYTYKEIQCAILAALYGMYSKHSIGEQQTEEILQSINANLSVLAASPFAAQNIFALGEIAKEKMRNNETITLTKQPYTVAELEAIRFYESLWGMVGERQRDDVCELLRLYGMDLYKEGLQLAKKQKKRSFPYIKAICENLSKDIRFDTKPKEEEKPNDGLTDIQRFCGNAWKEVTARKTNINPNGWSNPIIYKFAKKIDFTKHLGMQQATFMIGLSTYLEQHSEVMGGK